MKHKRTYYAFTRCRQATDDMMLRVLRTLLFQLGTAQRMAKVEIITTGILWFSEVFSQAVECC